MWPLTVAVSLPEQLLSKSSHLYHLMGFFHEKLQKSGVLLLTDGHIHDT